jgi:uncharacterized protein Yka (UPF0111/DUF47 family)
MGEVTSEDFVRLMEVMDETINERVSEVYASHVEDMQQLRLAFENDVRDMATQLHKALERVTAELEDRVREAENLCISQAKDYHATIKELNELMASLNPG